MTTATKAKTKKQIKEEKESQYVASALNITYTMPAGIVDMLASLSGQDKSAVWCQISEVANVCAVRLSTNKNQRKSWARKDFPGTGTKLRIDMDKYTQSTYYDRDLKKRITLETPIVEYTARIRIDGYSYEELMCGVNFTEKLLDTLNRFDIYVTGYCEECGCDHEVYRASMMAYVSRIMKD